MKINDKDIRFKFILENKEFFNKGIFINEYGINGKNVVDFALFKDGYFYGYEIKSEADNLKRIINQLKSYLKIFDYVYLIIHEKHKDETYELLKKYKLNRVGIYLVDKDIKFIKDRESNISIPIIRTRGFLNNLKKEDLLQLCSKIKLQPKVKDKDSLKNLLVGKITLTEIIEKLKNRLKLSYAKKCIKCKSNLIYNTSGYIEKITYENKVLARTVEVYKYKTTYKVNFEKCIECESTNNEKINEVMSKVLISKKVKKL